MDKQELNKMLLMRKKVCRWILFLLLILICGCETTKGVTKAAASGAAEDTKNLWQAILKLDNWLKDNLW